MSIVGNGGKISGNGIISIAPFILNSDSALLMYYSFEPSTYTNGTYANLATKFGYGGAVTTGTVSQDSNSIVGSSSAKSLQTGFLKIPDFSVNSDNFTFSFWIKRTPGGSGIQYPWGIARHNVAWQGAYFPDGSDNLIFPGSNFVDTSVCSIPTDNQWYHIAIVVRNNATVLYVNNTIVKTSTTALILKNTFYDGHA